MLAAAEELNWKQEIDRIAQITAEPDEYDLTLICDAIARSPYGHITEAMLILNSGVWDRAKFERCISALLGDGVLRVKQTMVFWIDRRKVPQVESGYVLSVPQVSTKRRVPSTATSQESHRGSPRW